MRQLSRPVHRSAHNAGLCKLFRRRTDLSIGQTRERERRRRERENLARKIRAAPAGSREKVLKMLTAAIKMKIALRAALVPSRHIPAALQCSFSRATSNPLSRTAAKTRSHGRNKKRGCQIELFLEQRGRCTHSMPRGKRRRIKARQIMKTVPRRVSALSGGDRRRRSNGLRKNPCSTLKKFNENFHPIFPSACPRRLSL